MTGSPRTCYPCPALLPVWGRLWASPAPQVAQLGLSPPFLVTHDPEPPQTFKPWLSGLHDSTAHFLWQGSAARGVFSPLHSLPPSLSAAFPVYVQPRDTFPPNPYLPCQPISPELAFAIFQSLPLPAWPVPVPPQGFLWPLVRAGNSSWLPAIVLGCERKRRAGKQELAQQNPPAPRPRIAFSSTGIAAGEQWGVSGAAPGCCCPPATALMPSSSRRKRRKGGSWGWQLPKFPPAAPWRGGAVDACSPSQGRVREAFTLSAAHWGPVWGHARSRNSTELWWDGVSPHLCRAGGSCRCSQRHHQCTCPGSGRGWKHTR